MFLRFQGVLEHMHIFSGALHVHSPSGSLLTGHRAVELTGRFEHALKATDKCGL